MAASLRQASSEAVDSGDAVVVVSDVVTGHRWRSSLFGVQHVK